ncbi:hypothetical protein [Geomonas anaerohicana]|uniref:Lipoprotein n=1 Tax=Geomonas anaerohicana TaxID=2798583 RepID=A0ABS0Y9V3_9BACT|nr:hypothetical protein [Geomonas anaerohicana]MBJ6748712.1 hypothetical protein [Geomonas anaerohicana]
MMKVLSKVSLLALSVALSGCVVGQSYRYHDTNLHVEASGNKSVAVAAVDRRPYVVSAEKEPNYVGTLRGGFGNPFNVTTESGKPLADDMSLVVCGSLKKKGFSCTPVTVPTNEADAQVKDKLKGASADRLMLLVIREWMSSTYTNTGLNYDVQLTEMDREGAVLAEKQLKGEDDLGGSFMNPPGHAKEAVPAAYKKKLELLLNDAAVAKELQ